MAKAKTGGSKPKPATVKTPVTSRELPASYYAGQNKKTKPQKDKNGDIIPG